jgi:putative membrane protein
VNHEAEPAQAARLADTSFPSLPTVDESDPGKASVELSKHRTKLSTARTEMSTRRTGMSFQRTRMSADRTLMSVIRTSLSLIGFGFTIFQIFQKMFDAKVLPSMTPARHFGTALMSLGVIMLIAGIGYHLAFMRGLRLQRNSMRDAGLIHAQSGFPASLTLMTALLLLLLGLVAIVSVVFRIGPLS